METLRKGEDEDRLAELRYKQEVRRDWSVLHNSGVSFTIICKPVESLSNFSGAGLSIVSVALSSELQLQ